MERIGLAAFLPSILPVVVSDSSERRGRCTAARRGLYRALLIVLAAGAAFDSPPVFGFGMGNKSPVVDSVSVSPSPVPADDNATITCAAHDPDGQIVSMELSVSAGALPGGVASAPVAITQAPSVVGTLGWSTPGPGSYTVRCDVKDNGGLFGGSAGASKLIDVEITEAASRAPTIESFSATATSALSGETITVSVVASDPEGAALAYEWTATGGTLAEFGATAQWTAACDPGLYEVSVVVTDPDGQSAAASLHLQVAFAIPGQSMPQGMSGNFRPTRLVVDGAGYVYAADPVSGTIEVFTPLGTWLRRIPVAGRPSAVAVDGERTLYVADAERGQVFILDLDGIVDAGASPRGVLGTGRGEFEAVTDMAVDPASGDVYVADAGAAVVAVYDETGAKIRTIAMPGSYPGGLALGPGGDLYVSDVRHGSVTRFSPTGVLLDTAGSFGGHAGQLTRVNGVVVAADGYMLAVDTFQSRLGVFAGTQFVAFLGSHGIGAGELSVPIDVAVDRWGRVLVTNTDNGRIEVLLRSSDSVPECSNDSDCDGITDAAELARGLDPFDARDAYADDDGDGVTNTAEIALGTDPAAADSDGDGVSDFNEACEGTDPMDPRDQGFWVDAGADFATAPTVVAMDARASRVHGNAPVTFGWSQVDGPETVTINGADSAMPWFVGRKPGSYQFRLFVGDGSRWSGEGRVKIEILDVAPTADAGPDVAYLDPHGTRKITLDGRYSSDANQDELSYSWVQTSGPAVQLRDTETARPSFKPGQAGLFALDLTVSDGGPGPGSTDRVYVVVESRTEHIPVAAAPDALRAIAGTLINLDASESVDIDGDSLTYSWRQLGGPAVTLADSGSAVASFRPTESGLYDFELRVNDGRHDSVPHVTVVAVHDASGSGPSANVEREIRSGAVLDPIILGCPITGAADATCAWRQIEGVSVPISGSGAASAFVATESGTYVFELEPFDSSGPGVPARLWFSLDDPDGNRVPSATATAHADTWRVGAKIALRATEIVDDGRRGNLDYVWTQVTGPPALLMHPNRRRARVTALLAGLYAFELRVSDGIDRSPAFYVEYVIPTSDRGGEQ